ncbi:hypothetical protein DFJ77DRAFT_356302 [Powellomyces hirtus]|nr:hypothetical protein DFJ77DRAFT_356302 [Powellomyces hirtus]
MGSGYVVAPLQQFIMALDAKTRNSIQRVILGNERKGNELAAQRSLQSGYEEDLPEPAEKWLHPERTVRTPLQFLNDVELIERIAGSRTTYRRHYKACELPSTLLLYEEAVCRAIQPRKVATISELDDATKHALRQWLVVVDRLDRHVFDFLQPRITPREARITAEMAGVRKYRNLLVERLGTVSNPVDCRSRMNPRSNPGTDTQHPI